ncbi:hypothetical protein [Alloactinosynnema sp. L-07]|nr:hypothetical protein [Alloactinosynnema sp. L-07]
MSARSSTIGLSRSIPQAATRLDPHVIPGPVVSVVRAVRECDS